METKSYTIGGKRVRVKVSDWFFPYSREGKRVVTTLGKVVPKPTRTHGVYIIKREGGRKPLYIGYSEGNLYKTFYRHFQQWDESNHRHATYRARHGYQCRVLIPPRRLVHELEKLLVNDLEPRDNHLRYTGTPNLFVADHTPADLMDIVLESPHSGWLPQPDGDLPF